MRESVWTREEIKKALSSVYNEPLMQRVDPHAYSDRREIPKYRVSDVALYLGIKERTLHNWFFGSSRTIGGEKRDYERLIEPALHNPQGPSLSFFNLAEAQVLAATRQKWVIADELPMPDPGIAPKFGQKPRRKIEVQVSMQAIRSAIDYVAVHSPSHPLISQYFYTNGKQLFIKTIEDQIGHALFINVSKGGQLGFASILDLYLQRIECDKSGFPIKVYPLRDVNDPDKTIVIISNVASGRPTVSGTGIRVETIWNRSQGGETTDALAEDYGIEPRVIEKAISYFTHVRAA
jgi:uncharacterized protein (DUF433 family)